jgi:hypothetical protein
MGTYRVRRRPRLVLALGLVLVLVAGAALGAVLTFAGTRVVRATSHHSTTPHRPSTRSTLGPPSVPVVVLNATTVNGAATRLATTLQSESVKIGGVADLSGPRPAGVQILYAPGDRSQARRLARVMSAQDPTVAPIDPAAAGAAGNGARLVVVIG